MGAFKYRGALNAIKKRLEQHPGEQLTFVTHSSGNHAQVTERDTDAVTDGILTQPFGLSWALIGACTRSKRLELQRDRGHGKPLTRCCFCLNYLITTLLQKPDNSPLVKQRAVRGYGAEVVLCEPTLEAREAAAQACVQRSNGYFVHPSNDVDVMSGQGTAALELLDQAKEQYGVELDAIVVPVGGGGLLSGVTMATKSRNDSVKVFAIEPEGAADAHHSFTTKQLSGHQTPPKTVADGLKTTLGAQRERPCAA